jgi:hypothetical protein
LVTGDLDNILICIPNRSDGERKLNAKREKLEQGSQVQRLMMLLFLIFAKAAEMAEQRRMAFPFCLAYDT